MKKPATLEEAIRNMDHMIKGMAHKWTRNHYSMTDDLYQQGRIGVIEAWNRYDENSPAAFSSYAFFWIRKMIREYTLKEWDNMNHQAAEELMLDGEQVINEDLIDICMQIEKLSEREQAVFLYRSLGHTFNEVSQKLVECGMDKSPKSIGHIRKEYIGIRDQLS